MRSHSKRTVASAVDGRGACDVVTLGALLLLSPELPPHTHVAGALFGGAIYFGSGFKSDVDQSSFVNNVAHNCGGALYVVEGSASLKASHSVSAHLAREARRTKSLFVLLSTRVVLYRAKHRKGLVRRPRP